MEETLAHDRKVPGARELAAEALPQLLSLPCPSGCGTRGFGHELFPGTVQVKPFSSAG